MMNYLIMITIAKYIIFLFICEKGNLSFSFNLINKFRVIYDSTYK
jgi:hypothetical protein